MCVCGGVCAYKLCVCVVVVCVCVSISCVCVCVCVYKRCVCGSISCVCGGLLPEVFGVQHAAHQQQGPRGLVPDQVQEGPVHVEQEVALGGGGAGVLGPLRGHLHDNPVVDGDELGGLGADVHQVGLGQPIRETCEWRGCGR